MGFTHSKGLTVINGVFLDSIGLALFSLAWWGWLIGGGLAVVGMLFGVHVAVGAPPAQARSCEFPNDPRCYYEPGHPLYYSGPSKEVQMADALSSGDTDRYLELKGDTQAQLGNALSRGDIGAGASYAQQMQQESSGTSSGTSSSSSSASSGSGSSGGYSAPDGSTWVSKAAYDDFHRDYDAEYAQWQKDMAAWEAQYGGGGSGAPSAPAAPGPSPSSGAAIGNNPWMADPYWEDANSSWASDLYALYYGSGSDGGKRIERDQEAAKRYYDSDKPLVMRVNWHESQTFIDRSYALVAEDGTVNEAGARALAQELVKGEVLKAGDLESARASAIGWANSYQGEWEYFQGAGDFEFTERNEVYESKAKAVVASYLVEALNQEIEAAEAEKQATVTPRKTKRGAKVLNSEVGQDGRMSATVKTKLKEGSTAQVAVHGADANGAWKEETSKVKVGKGGVVNFSTDVEKNNYVYLENSKGKMLVRWTTA